MGTEVDFRSPFIGSLASKQRLQPDEQSTPTQVRAFREEAVTDIERRAAELVANGEQRRWLESADDEAARVPATVNGPLVFELAQATGFADAESVFSLRKEHQLWRT